MTKQKNKTTEQQDNLPEKALEQEAVVKTVATPVVLFLSKKDSIEVARLSVLAWQKNFVGHPIFIVGGTLDGIPVIETEAADNEDVNLANALAAIVAAEEVGEKFILSPVSTFPVNELQEEVFDVLKCKSKKLQDKRLVCLKEFTELATVNQLKKAGIADVTNCETGFPVLYEKEKVTAMFEQFNPQKTPVKVTSLYLNFHRNGRNTIPLDYKASSEATGVWRKEANLNLVKEGLQKSQFFLVNTDGYMAAGKLIEEKIAE